MLCNTITLAGVWAMSGAVDHLAMAKQYLGEAFKFLEREDPFDACEKFGLLLSMLQQF
jgi:hypothetical protein